MLLYLLLALRKRSDLRMCPWIMNDVSILIVTNELFPHYFLLLYRIILTMKKILSRQAYMTKYNAKTKHKYVRKCQRISRSVSVDNELQDGEEDVEEDGEEGYDIENTIGVLPYSTAIIEEENLEHNSETMASERAQLASYLTQQLHIHPIGARINMDSNLPVRVDLNSLGPINVVCFFCSAMGYKCEEKKKMVIPISVSCVAIRGSQCFQRFLLCQQI